VNRDANGVQRSENRRHREHRDQKAAPDLCWFTGLGCRGGEERLEVACDGGISGGDVLAPGSGQVGGAHRLRDGPEQEVGFGIADDEVGLELPGGIGGDVLKTPGRVVADVGERGGDANLEDEVGVGGRGDELVLGPAFDGGVEGIVGVGAVEAEPSKAWRRRRPCRRWR